jgi:hypothetical protein
VSAFEVGKSFSVTEALALLSGLQYELGSLYFMEINGWDYPSSRVELNIANLYDLLMVINSDPKKRSQLKPHGRPFEILDDNQSKITKLAIPLERADILYKTTKQTKTDEEILKINRQKILAKKQKEETQNEQAT